MKNLFIPKSLQIAIVTTVADAADSINQFIDFHLSIGFSTIYLFIDDNCAITYKKAQKYKNVVCFLRDEELMHLWQQTPPYIDDRKNTLINEEVMVRQEMNFFVAFYAAKHDGIDWVLHIDLDELFFLNGISLLEHFSELKKNSISSITYLNYEAIYTKQSENKDVYGAQFFKINFLRHRHWVFSKEQRDFIKDTPWLKDKYFNYYQNGKSAVSTLYKDITLFDVHSIVAPGNRKMGKKTDPVILHFPCPRESDFIRKYKRLGRFSNQWMGTSRVGAFIERVHLEARDLCMNGTQAEISRFYESHFILNQEQIKNLIEMGMAIEISWHLNRIKENIEKDFSSRAITTEWKQWIAENLVINNNSAEIYSLLLEKGMPEQPVRKALDEALESPFIQGTQRLKGRLKKREWVLDIYRRLNRLRTTEVKRRFKLTREDFLNDHYSINQPVLITGMMEDWVALEKWNLDYFAKNFEERVVEVQFGRNSDEHYEINKIAHKKSMRFGDYVNLIRTTPQSNDFYMTANNDSLNRVALKELWDDIVQLPEYLDQTQGNQGFLWFGPKGTITPLHHDLTNNFMAQVIGSKRLVLVPACEIANVYNEKHCFSPIDANNIDLARFPNMTNAKVMECVLNPGEVLFLPVGWWHYVEGLETSVTITFTNFLWDNAFYNSYPEQQLF